MTAFLTEEAAFAAVPPLAGFAELVEAATAARTTMAMAQQFVADGADAFESVAEALTPGSSPRARSAWSSRRRSPPISAP